MTALVRRVSGLEHSPWVSIVLCALAAVAFALLETPQR
jgi:hypothetical protein